MDKLINAEWIWCGNYSGEVNQYAAFRCVFTAKNTGTAQLYISADWDFVVKVNGVEIGMGQFPDYPDQKTVSMFEIPNLCVGKNVISIEAYAPGEDFLAMADRGATTFWETALGSKDFDGAGSMCHAWSSIHVGFYGKRTLGVTPLAPGFKKFEVKPYPGNCDFASGEIPTPSGNIEISWKKDASGRISVNICHPRNLTPTVSSYEEFPIGDVTISQK